jgi:hypothetical protein
MLPVVILIAPFAVALATCLFPIAGVLTLITAIIVAVIAQGQKLGGFMPIFMFLIPCWIVFHLAIRLEARVEESAGYRAARHVYRLITGGIVVHNLALRFTGPFPKGMPLLQRLSPLYFVIVVAGLVGIYFLSRKLDADFGGAETVYARLRLRRAEG